jgi:hypothetical protein
MRAMSLKVSPGRPRRRWPSRHGGSRPPETIRRIRTIGRTRHFKQADALRAVRAGPFVRNRCHAPCVANRSPLKSRTRRPKGSRSPRLGPTGRGSPSCERQRGTELAFTSRPFAARKGVPPKIREATMAPSGFFRSLNRLASCTRCGLYQTAGPRACVAKWRSLNSSAARAETD